ncbi:CHASE2 domain-containing protein [Nanoarchaeota archaeon]
MKKLKAYLLVSLVVFCLTSTFFCLGYLSNVDLILSDNLYGGGIPLSNIVIVAIDDESLQEIGRWPWDRTVIASVINKLNESKVIGVDIGFFETSERDADFALAKSMKGKNVVLAAEYTTFSAGDRLKGEDSLVPIDALGSVISGYVNVVTDKDGVTRAINNNVEGDFRSFPEAIAKQVISKDISSADRYLINFVGPPNSFERVSYVDIFENRIDYDYNNKIVLIGATSPDLHDNYFVPTSKGNAMPGVEIIANAIQSMILDNELTQQSKFSVILILFIVSFFVALIYFYVRIRYSTIIFIVAIIAYLFLAIFFVNRNILLNIVYVPFTITLNYVALLGFSYKFKKKEKEEVSRAFGKYVSPEVINEVLKNPEKLALGGERRTVTLFFSDIRGFTPISEALTPEQLVSLLNEYLTEMTDIIIEQKGIVDKYMGDAIMAFWGAPLKQEDHAIRAATVSLLMMKRLKQLQKKWAKQNIPFLDIGIGLNSGEAVVGNMGSHQRFDYTVMGDVVNLASRLEGVNKPYGTHILISEATYALVKEQYACRKIDRIKVKGKDIPITIYELVNGKFAASAEEKKVIEKFEKGLEYYFKQKWDDAIASFKEVLKLSEKDGPSKVFIKRCEEYKKSPPGKEWNGVFVMTTK